MSEENIAGWRVEVTPYYNCAEREQTRVDVDDETLTVDAEQGSGYMREHITTYVPFSVLFRLLESQGYTVTRSEHPSTGEGQG